MNVEVIKQGLAGLNGDTPAGLVREALNSLAEALQDLHSDLCHVDADLRRVISAALGARDEVRAAMLRIR